MKKFIVLSGFLMLFALDVRAQEKVGFSNPGNIDPIIEYRLPDWGYDNFFLDFSLDGIYLRNDASAETFDYDEKMREIATLVNPNYQLYRESEQRIIELNTSANLQYRNSERELDDGTFDRKRHAEQVQVSVSLREYLRPKWFVLGSQATRLSHSNSSLEQTDSESDDLQRNIFSSSTLGIGYGRVRNVNPVIRALRLKERYGVLSNGQSLNSAHVKKAAEVFTKYDGYQSRYDRPEKYFWEAMDQALNGAVSGMQPFDLFYLSDVLNENIGQRFEGWDITAGGSFDYRNYLSRSDEDNDSNGSSFSRSLTISKYALAFIRGRWYKNLSLRHQISFQSELNRSYRLSDQSVLDRTSNATVSAAWLWNITDRLLVNTQISNSYYHYHVKDDIEAGGQTDKPWRNLFSVDSKLTYFIENRLAINAGMQYERSSGDDFSFLLDQDDRVLQFSAGLNYYFSRNLYR